MKLINNTTVLDGEDLKEIVTEAEKDFAEYLADAERKNEE